LLPLTRNAQQSVVRRYPTAAHALTGSPALSDCDLGEAEKNIKQNRCVVEI
jgi:hypothetical protein